MFYNSTDKGAKYDFVVHPGADPKQIELVYSSSEQLKLDNEGNLIIQTEIGALTEGAPFSYIKKTAHEVISQFKVINEQHYSLGAAEYYQTTVRFDFKTQVSNLKSTLVIDPQLFWATFYGGNEGEMPFSIDTDNAGNVFVTGMVISPDFPVQDAGTFFQGNFGGSVDIFILKFSNTGVLLWATFYGGDGQDIGFAVATDGSGNVFITGETSSINFPVQNAGTFFQDTLASGYSDVIILKFDNAGNRIWATYYGGLESEYASSIATDGNGNVFITGRTTSRDFPVQNAGTFFKETYDEDPLNIFYDLFILKFNNAGNRLWATYYGGNSNENVFSIATDGNNNVLITGYTGSTNFPMQNAGTFFQGTTTSENAFISKFDNTGNLLWSTYYGGIDGGGAAHCIAADDNSNIFVLGYTTSLTFPLQDAGTFFQGTYGGGFSDAFILKFDSIGNLTWATYYGGSNNDNPWTPFSDLVITSCGTVYVIFGTSSNNIITQASCDEGYYDNTLNSYSDIIAQFSNTGILLWSTYIEDLAGGSASGSTLAVDNAGGLFVSGLWDRANFTFPLANPGEEPIMMIHKMPVIY